METIRFSGMASGLDTQSIVDNLMRAERIPLDKIKQQKQSMQWKLEDYRSMNTKLQTFRDSLLTMRLQSTYMSKSVASSDSSKIEATANSSAGNVSYSFDKVERLASAATNNSTASISNDANKKLEGAKSISSQRDLISGFTWKSSADGVTEGIKVKADGTNFRLSTLTSGGEVDFTGTAPVVTVDGAARNLITDENAELGENDVRISKAGAIEFGSAVAAGSDIKVDYNYTQKDTLRTSTATSEIQLRQQGFLADGAVIKTATFTTGDDGQRTYGSETTWQQRTVPDGGSLENTISTLAADEYVVGNDGKIHFGSELAANTELRASYAHEYAEGKLKVHQEGEAVEKTFKFNAGATLNQVVSQVNSAKIGVNMFYDEQSGRMAISRTETGNFNGTEAEPLPEIEYGTDPDDFFSNFLKMDSDVEKGGENAKFTMNGLATERTSNSFSINGMSFTLKGTFDQADGDNPVSLTSTNNADDAVEKIKKFVEDYNKLVDDLNGKVREDVNRDYKPLTDEQRDSLSEKEIEKWETEARKGNLKNDQYLRGALEGMRSNLYNSIDTDGPFSNLTQIGITTTSNYMDGGKLEIDETKLKEALETDANSVFQLFAADEGENRGIARQIGDSVSNTITRITDHAGNGLGSNQSFTLGRNLDDIDGRISDFERRLQASEERHWKQFTAFERAMQQQNDQLNYMMSQLGMAPQQ